MLFSCNFALIKVNMIHVGSDLILLEIVDRLLGTPKQECPTTTKVQQHPTNGGCCCETQIEF